MFNVLESAMSVITTVCPQIEVTLKMYPQIQKKHNDMPPPVHHEVTKILPALVQASTSHLSSQTHHLNTGRVYKLYLVNTDYDIVSYLQHRAYHLTATFLYSKKLTTTQLIGFEDCKYNGWIRLDTTETRSVNNNGRIKLIF